VLSTHSNNPAAGLKGTARYVNAQVARCCGLRLRQEVVEQAEELLHDGILAEIVVAALHELAVGGAVAVGERHALGLVHATREGDALLHIHDVWDGVVAH